jgi:hypothetical protein
MREIQNWDEVPAFKTEVEETEFWATHALGDGILQEMGPVADDELPPARPRTRPIAVRFDQDVVRRLRTLAARKHKGYQTLLKEFVVERLYEEEKREGLVG